MSNQTSSHNHNSKFFQNICFIILLFSALYVNNLFAQAELTPWGSMTGFRREGHLIKFNSSVCVIDSSMADLLFTNGDNQRRMYYRKDGNQVVTSVFSKFDYTETVQKYRQKHNEIKNKNESRRFNFNRHILMH